MRNKDLKIIVDLFKFYIIQITKDESYRFKMTDNNNTMILSFIEKVKNQTNSTFLSPEYCKDYFEYQFNHWYRNDAKFGKGKSIQLNWIIGAKALTRWNNRTDKQRKATSYFVRKGLKNDVKIKEFDSVKKELKKELIQHLIEVNDIEEFEKERFLNSTKGFVNCQINTTLYNHKSNNCSVCKYSTDCKELLKTSLTKVYKARNYN